MQVTNPLDSLPNKSYSAGLGCRLIVQERFGTEGGDSSSSSDDGEEV